LTELRSKNQFLEAILKTAAILEQSKNQLGLKLEVVVHILKYIFAKFEENRRCAILDICNFVKPFFSKKLFHFYLPRGRWGNRITLILILNERTENFTKEKHY
jgi:hypothetical protein